MLFTPKLRIWSMTGAMVRAFCSSNPGYTETIDSAVAHLPRHELSVEGWLHQGREQSLAQNLLPDLHQLQSDHEENAAEESDDDTHDLVVGDEDLDPAELEHDQCPHNLPCRLGLKCCSVILNSQTVKLRTKFAVAMSLSV